MSTITAQDLVSREVIYCVSTLVHTIASTFVSDFSDLNDAAEQAFDLAAPIPDYEEAALQHGWAYDRLQEVWVHPDVESPAVNQEDACEQSGIEPHDREVFEHWIVSDWLADRLETRGEKVDRDFLGLVVWARTTTGQVICMDSILEAIANDVNARKAP